MSNLWATLTYRWSTLDARGRAIAGAAAAGLALLVAILVFAVCSGGGEPVAIATTLPPPPTTQPPASTSSTTTVPPTTTTLAAELEVALTNSPDEAFTAAVTDVYRYVAGEPGAGESLVSGLTAHLEAAVPAEVPLALDGEAAWAFLRWGGRVAVAQVGDDVVLAADEGDGSWQVVGANLPSVEAAPWYGDEPRHVLIIGSDARWNQDVFGARSDSLHVLSAAPSQRRGAIVGIPRDSWVPSAVGGTGKITNVLAAGGPDAVFRTVQNLSGLPLEGWIITGFLGFEVIVNDFGGLVVDLPGPVRGGLPGFPNYPAGTQELDGPTALLLARIRKTLPRGDFDRSLNHGVIMLSALLQVQDRGMLDLPLMLSILAESSHYSLTPSQLLTLGATAFELSPAEVDNLVLPGRTGSVGEASVVFLNDSGSAAIWADVADGALDQAG